MARIGYARCSSTDQNFDVQVQRLRDAGCDIVRAEKVSGKSREGRDELATIMDFIQPGDEVVCVKLDRLGRSTRDVLNLVHELQAKGAALSILEPAFSTNDPAGSILVTVLGMVGELERDFIKSRQAAGIAALKARDPNAYKGRKPSVPVERVRQMHASGERPSDIAKALGISRMSVYRALEGQAA